MAGANSCISVVTRCKWHIPTSRRAKWALTFVHSFSNPCSQAVSVHWDHHGRFFLITGAWARASQVALVVKEPTCQSVQFSSSAMSSSLWPHGPQHTRPPHSQLSRVDEEPTPSCLLPLLSELRLFLCLLARSRDGEESKESCHQVLGRSWLKCSFWIIY